jgi:aldehyde:ferredoxin oxidoreductase
LAAIPKRQFQDCLLFRYFQSWTFETMIETLNTVTGAGYDKEDCLKIGRRIINLLRMFNIREEFKQPGK